jgi:hypothetical protein
MKIFQRVLHALATVAKAACAKVVGENVGKMKIIGSAW